MSDDGHDLLDGSTSEFVTVRIAGQLFGLPILAVEDVFAPNPGASVNLGGRGVAQSSWSDRYRHRYAQAAEVERPRR